MLFRSKLLESDIVTSLNLPSKIADPSWIRPGKIARAASPAALRSTIDFAASAGLEYVLAASIDQDIAAYARQKNVGLWLSADWRIVESEMDQSFPQLATLGVRGVRVEGWTREDQDAVVLLHKIAAKAAEHKLMLAIGGGYKPDGLQRVYPNVLTVEAALTADSAKVGAAANPQHEVDTVIIRHLRDHTDPVRLQAIYGKHQRDAIHPVARQHLHELRPFVQAIEARRSQIAIRW